MHTNNKSPRVSVIIPTHNRIDFLQKVINRLLAINDSHVAEIIIVDNASSDLTSVCIGDLCRAHPGIIKYVFERQRSASAARNAGARLAVGDILVFLDDDVFVQPDAISSAVDTFDQHPDCAVISAQIVPMYEADPPDWAVECQRSYNGWSLHYPGNIPHLPDAVQEYAWAIGAMLAITRKAFDDIGGYPDDIVMIETEPASNKFFRLDIGAGDSGISYLVRSKGYSIYYNPDFMGFHLVNKSRMTPRFWRARMIGDAHYHSVSNRVFWKKSFIDLRCFRWKMIVKFYDCINRLRRRLSDTATTFDGILPDEMWLYYYRSVLYLDDLFLRNQGVCDMLRQVSSDGIASGKYTLASFPTEYQMFIRGNMLSDLQSMRSLADLDMFLSFLPANIKEQLASFDKIVRQTISVFPNTDSEGACAFFAKEENWESVENYLQKLCDVNEYEGEFRKWLCFLQIRNGKKQEGIENFKKACLSLTNDIEIIRMASLMKDNVDVNPAGVFSHEPALMTA